MDGELVSVSDLYPTDRMDRGPVYGSGGGGGSTVKLIVNPDEYVVGIVIFSSAAIASAVVDGYTVTWNWRKESPGDFKKDLMDKIDNAIDDFMRGAAEGTPRPTYVVGLLDDRGSVLPSTNPKTKVVEKFSFGRLCDLYRMGSGGSDDPAETGEVTVVETEECQYYAAVEGWGEEGQTGGEDEP